MPTITELTLELSEKLKSLKVNQVIIDFEALLKVNLMHNPDYISYHRYADEYFDFNQEKFSELTLPTDIKLPYTAEYHIRHSAGLEQQKQIKGCFNHEFLRNFFFELRSKFSDPKLNITIYSHRFSNYFMTNMLYHAELLGFCDVIYNDKEKAFYIESIAPKEGRILLIDNTDFTRESLPSSCKKRILRFKKFPPYDYDSECIKVTLESVEIEKIENYYGLSSTMLENINYYLEKVNKAISRPGSASSSAPTSPRREVRRQRSSLSVGDGLPQISGVGEPLVRSVSEGHNF